MSYRKNHSEREFLFEETKDISSSSTFKSSPLKDDKYFILHHTAGRGTAMDVMNVLNTRHLGVQWIIDRDGKLYKSLPSGHRGAHIKMIRPSVPKDLSNRTTQNMGQKCFSNQIKSNLNIFLVLNTFFLDLYQVLFGFGSIMNFFRSWIQMRK